MTFHTWTTTTKVQYSDAPKASFTFSTSPFGKHVAFMLTLHVLAFAKKAIKPYITDVGQPTMAINAVRNKRYGPGGGTRRLHHNGLIHQGGWLYGGETGSTCVVKVLFSLGMVSAVIGPNLEMPTIMRHML